jgi:hypothetical protein
MTLEDNIKEIVSIQYNCIRNGETRKRYKTILYRDPEDFLRYVYQRDNDQATVDTIIDPSGSELFIRNDIEPTYYTSFDDTTVVFDSYDSSVDNTLQSSKIVCTAYVLDEWTHDDDFIPNLPADAFPALLEEAKSKSFIKVAQREDPTAAVEARRQQTWLARKAWRVAGGIQYPNYGRNRSKGYKDPTFCKDYV